MATQPLQLSTSLCTDKENTAERQLTTSPSTTAIQASPASILVQHNQLAVSNNMGNFAHCECCIAFLRCLTFTTATMCKFTIILAEAVKAGYIVCCKLHQKIIFTHSNSLNLTNLMWYDCRVLSFIQNNARRI